MTDTTPYWNESERAEALSLELERLHDKLDRIVEAVAHLDRRRRELEEILLDALPAANGAVGVATAHLEELERSGALELIREGAAAAGTAAARIDPADLRALGENADLGVRTLRALTGPEVSTVTERAVGALRAARTGKPPGLLALLSRARKPHVRRGMGAALEILEALGEGASPGGPAPAPVARPRRAPTRPERPDPPAPSAPAGAGSSVPAGERTLEVEGRRVSLDADGFLVDPDAWSPAVAEALAAEVGLGPLTDEHWRVLEFARKDASETGAAPGLRRITKELEIPPKTIYALFPKGPGLLAARLAGLGKPKSCV